MESGAGIQEILMATPHFQRVEYFFEKIVSVTDARLDTWFDIYRAIGLPGKVRSQLSLEMYPVDCPWVTFVRTVCMRYSCGQYEILVGFYGILLFIGTKPAGSLYTVNKDKLANGFRTFPEVM